MTEPTERAADLKFLQDKKDRLLSDLQHIELCIKQTKRALESAEDTGD